MAALEILQYTFTANLNPLAIASQNLPTLSLPSLTTWLPLMSLPRCSSHPTCYCGYPSFTAGIRFAKPHATLRGGAVCSLILKGNRQRREMFNKPPGHRQ